MVDGFDTLHKSILEGKELNFPTALELILLEFLNRFIVCVFEVRLFIRTHFTTLKADILFKRKNLCNSRKTLHGPNGGSCRKFNACSQQTARDSVSYWSRSDGMAKSPS